MQKGNCIFCEIVSNKIPSKKVYEDDTCLVFENIVKYAEDVNFLIIPKLHYENYLQCPSETFLKVQQVAITIKEKYNLTHLSLATNYKEPYQQVFHAHFHLNSGKILEVNP